MYLVYVFFRKDSMKVNMDKIRQYEGSRKKYNPNRWIYHDVKSFTSCEYFDILIKYVV